ncbi:OmpA family protein [Rhodoferax koreense]|nr:OmpA family protein [Rhodoferax koreense]
MNTKLSRNWLTTLGLLLLLMLAACTSPPPRPPASPFEQDVFEATDALAGQWRGKAPFRPRWPAQRLALGPFVDLSTASTAQGAAFGWRQTVAAVRVRQVVAQHIEQILPGIRLVPATLGSADDQADLLLSASLIPFVSRDQSASPAGRPNAAGGNPNPPLMLTLVLLDLKTRNVVARWQSPLRTQAADANPSPFDAESPVLINQSAAEGRSTLFSAPMHTAIDGPSVQDALGLARLEQAQQAYASGHYPKALNLFQEVAAKSPEQALRAANGEYLSYLKLGQPEAAKQAFKRVVAMGLASRRLAVKLLFTPGQTEFWADPAVSGAYGFWLQEISTQAAAAPTCLEIAGHTSRSGTEAFNLGLSLARSERVRQTLLAQQPRLAGRLRASGKGWSENIVGSGSDDARDAIDRRVEFKVADCAAL